MAKKTDEDKVEEVKEEKKSVKAKKLEGVTVGQNVLYVSPGGYHSSATITAVHNKDTGLVNLFVMRDDVVRDYHFETSVSYSEGNETGTWHFIEKK